MLQCGGISCQEWRNDRLFLLLWFCLTLSKKLTISCFFSILGKKLLCQEYQAICQKNIWMEQICVYHFKPMKLKAFLFTFWLSFGRASTGNFVQKFISKQEESKKKKKLLEWERREREDTHLDYIVLLLKNLRRV